MNKILNCSTPREAKALGRKVKNYDDKVWDKQRDNCMYSTIMVKYVQCPEFREILQNNQDKIFAEASPYDNIWGIKLSEDDPKALDPSKWEGENRLGKCINKLNMDMKRIEYLRSIYEMVTYESECWCALNGEDIENLDEETMMQCVVDVASALDLTEEDVENILNEYLE